MTVKEYLQNGRRLCFEIKELSRAKNNAFDIACSTTLNLSKDKVQKSSKNMQEQKLINYSHYVFEIEKRIEILCKYRIDMLNLINNLDNVLYRTVLIDRYINCLTWEEVAAGLNLSVRHILRMHGKALTAIKRFYK